MTTKGAKDLGVEAKGSVETLTAEDALKLMGDSGVAFVDVREGEELQRTGTVQGAGVHVPGGSWSSRPTRPARATNRSWAGAKAGRIDFVEGGWHPGSNERWAELRDDPRVAARQRTHRESACQKRAVIATCPAVFCIQVDAGTAETEPERIDLQGKEWCCQRGLNSRPLPYQGSALPLSYGSLSLDARLLP